MGQMGSSGLGAAFHRLLVAGGAANLADGMTRVVLPLLALEVGASASGVAGVTAASTLAWPLFGLHAGWIVDRADRRMLLVSANLVRGATLAALTLALTTDHLSLWMILTAALALGLSETIVDTATTACIPTVVDPSALGRANSRVEAVVNATNELAGPALAGLIAGATLTLAVGSGSGLYLAAAAILAGLAANRLRLDRGRGNLTGTDARPPRSRVSDGLRFIWASPLLRALVLFTAAMNVVWGGAIALLVVYAVEPGPLDLTPGQYGMLLTAMAAGGLLASMVTERLRRLVGDARLLVADCVGTVLLVLPVALDAGVAAVAAGAVVAGAGSSVWRIVNATIRQLLTPDALLGRVYAATRVISWGVVPIAATTAGIVADTYSLHTAFVALTVIAVAVVLAFLPFASDAARVSRTGEYAPHPKTGPDAEAGTR